MAAWHKLLYDIPDSLLSPEQKSDAKAAIALHVRIAEERFGLFHGGHAAAAQRIHRLIKLLPGAKLMTSKEAKGSRWCTSRL